MEQAEKPLKILGLQLEIIAETAVEEFCSIFQMSIDLCSLNVYIVHYGSAAGGRAETRAVKRSEDL